MLIQIQTTNTNLPQMGFYGKKWNCKCWLSASFHRIQDSDCCKYWQIKMETVMETLMQMQKQIWIHILIQIFHRWDPGSFDPTEGRGWGQLSVLAAIHLNFSFVQCTMSIYIYIFPWSRRFLFSKIVRKINACIACIRNTVLYDIQCHVNGVVYFCVTCVNASRILGDQHGIVCGIVLYYMYVVLYRTFASIIPA